MNLLTPDDFSTLFFLGDLNKFLHTNYEIDFDFDDGKPHKTNDELSYVIVIKGVTDDLYVFIDHVCGGRLYIKECRHHTIRSIKESLLEYAAINKKEPRFIVDCDKFFEEIRESYKAYEHYIK